MTDFEKKIEEFVVDLYKIKVVKFGHFVLKSGITSPIYFDLRIIVSYPKLLIKLSELLAELLEMRNIETRTICGVPYTALPIATLVSTSLGIPMVVRRKEKKDYGTAKMVEGEFTAGSTCLIIEDVISTGSSILETAKDLEDAGLRVTDTVVVLDREHGAARNLESNGVRPHVLVTLTKLLTILYSRGHITEQIVSDVRAFIHSSQMSNGVLTSDARLPSNPRTSRSFGRRAEAASHPIAKKLLRLMEEKQSLLCLAADVTNAEELLTVAADAGPHIAVLKTHADAMSDFSAATAEKLVELARTHNFIIMEDRKYADIGNTVRLQFATVEKWAELVTAHSLPGPGVVAGLKEEAGSEPHGVFLVAQLSSAGALTDSSYAKKTIEMAETLKDSVVGIVAQSGDLVTSPNLIQLTPGVRLSVSGDGLGQQYVDPRSAVLKRGADLVVVGRGILEAEHRGAEALKYKTLLWEAYRERVSD